MEQRGVGASERWEARVGGGLHPLLIGDLNVPFYPQKSI